MAAVAAHDYRQIRPVDQFPASVPVGTFLAVIVGDLLLHNDLITLIA